MIRFCFLKAPFCPPKPMPPKITHATSTYEDNIKSLWHSLDHTDVNLVTGNHSYSAHRCFLAAASPAFYRLFTMELVQEYTPRSSSDSSMVNIRFSFKFTYRLKFSNSYL